MTYNTVCKDFNLMGRLINILYDDGVEQQVWLALVNYFEAKETINKSEWLGDFEE